MAPPARALSALTVAAIVTASLALLLAAFSRTPFTLQFIETDKLLAADWTRHVFVDGYAWQGFQLPRIPSLFPDLAIVVPTQLITGSFRVALFVYAALSMGALLALTGLLVDRMTGVGVVRCATWAWLIVLAILVAETIYSGVGRHFSVLQPLAHGGAFLTSLAALLLAMSMAERRRWWAMPLLLSLCAVTVLSNRIFVFYFVAPIAVAVVLTRTAHAASARIIVSVVIGTLIGWLSAGLLNTQPSLPLAFSDVVGRSARFFHDMPRSVLVGTMAPAVVLLGAAWLARRFAPQPREAAQWRLIVVFATAAMLGSIGLVAGFLYEDVGSYRYLAPLIWWPVILGVALVARCCGDWPVERAAVAVCAITAALPFWTGVATPGSLWRWRHAAVPCLMGEGLRDGLAGYWQARPIKASSEWQLQVDPITPQGDRYLWGNDPADYTRSNFDPAAAPNYRFVVMDDLDAAAIARRMGQPERTLQCGPSTVWIFPALTPP